MNEREKVINALMCWRDAAALQKWTGDCDSCAFAKSKTGDCIDIAPIIDGTIDLLKADQTYLLDKDEKIKKLHLLLNAKLSAQPLVKKLTERLQRIADIAGDYDNYPTRNGLEWVCIEIQEIAVSGLQEVKDD